MYHLRAIVYICNLMVRVVSVVEFNIVIYQLQNYGVGFCSFEVPQSDRLHGKAERSSYRPGTEKNQNYYLRTKKIMANITFTASSTYDKCQK